MGKTKRLQCFHLSQISVWSWKLENFRGIAQPDFEKGYGSWLQKLVTVDVWMCGCVWDNILSGVLWFWNVIIKTHFLFGSTLVYEFLESTHYPQAGLGDDLALKNTLIYPRFNAAGSRGVPSPPHTHCYMHSSHPRQMPTGPNPLWIEGKLVSELALGMSFTLQQTPKMGIPCLYHHLGHLTLPPLPKGSSVPCLTTSLGRTFETDLYF